MRLLTSAFATRTALSFVRYLLKRLKFLNWAKQPLQMLCTCALNEKSLSINTPRLQTTLAEWRRLSSILTGTNNGVLLVIPQFNSSMHKSTNQCQFCLWCSKHLEWFTRYCSLGLISENRPLWKSTPSITVVSTCSYAAVLTWPGPGLTIKWLSAYEFANAEVMQRAIEIKIKLELELATSISCSSSLKLKRSYLLLLLFIILQCFYVILRQVGLVCCYRSLMSPSILFHHFFAWKIDKICIHYKLQMLCLVIIGSLW